MEDLILKGQALLIEKVINQGTCVGCGACVGLCPYFHYFDGKVAVIDRCGADTWRCLQLCPRAGYEDTSPQPEETTTAGNGEIGPYREVIMARSKDKNIRIFYPKKSWGLISHWSLVQIHPLPTFFQPIFARSCVNARNLSIRSQQCLIYTNLMPI